MDACTRCGEAIPVVWARNTGDPGSQAATGGHTHTHTQHNTHLTQQIRAHPRQRAQQSPQPTAQSPPRTQDPGPPPRRPDARPRYTLRTNNPDRHHPSITTSTTHHPSAANQQPHQRHGIIATRWRLHDDMVLLETPADPVHLMTASREYPPRLPAPRRAHSSSPRHTASRITHHIWHQAAPGQHHPPVPLGYTMKPGRP